VFGAYAGNGGIAVDACGVCCSPFFASPDTLFSPNLTAQSGC
jgi:hypothetical protein